ncbi:MAG: LysR family transcriptional regulator [Betaproteobacteria bacterium]|nr:LysR family transcriptional regulator [Betaproteobacteria bacterium]
MADRRLQVFHAVAKHLSFTRAAEYLFLSQSAVTFQVRQLEDQYRTRLFERRHGSIALTLAGEMVLSYAERILALSDELDVRMADMTGELRGPLAVGVSTSAASRLLPPLAAAFNAAHPQARMTVTVANSARIEGAVARQELDVGLVDGPSGGEGIEAVRCCDDELVVAVSPDHPLLGARKISPKVLADFEYLSREPGSGTRAVTEAWFAAHGVAPDSLKVQMELGSPEALLGVVASGLGFAVVSRRCTTDVPGIAIRALEPELRRDILLVTARDRFRTRLVARFGEFARQHLAEWRS